MKISHRILIASMIALVVFFFAWEWYLSPEARVKAVLERVAEAAEDKDTARLLSCFSREYSDFRNQDYDSLVECRERVFSRVDRLNITLESVRPEVRGVEATASLDLTVVAIRGQERYLVVGAPMQPEKLAVELEREEGQWKIRRINQY